jgi:hypothetical protein
VSSSSTRATIIRAERFGLGDDSDNVRYDPAARRLFVGFGNGALASISAADGSVLGEAKLGGHPESFRFLPNDCAVVNTLPTPHARKVLT